MTRAFFRLYVQGKIYKNTLLTLNDQQNHYIKNVIRLQEKDKLLIFDDHHTEWRGEILKKDKKNFYIKPLDITRQEENKKFLELVFAPLKKPALEILIEKATELGVTHFTPLITQNTYVKKVNIEKLRLLTIQASQQSDRLDEPCINTAISFADFLKARPSCVKIVGQERKTDKNIVDLSSFASQPVSLIIGPEGGFTNEEINIMQGRPDFYLFSFNKAVLRAETAAIAALSIIQFHLL